MSFFVYTYDDSIGKPKISTINQSNLLLADGSVGLTADWNAGAFQISVSQDPTAANHLARKSYVDAAVSALSGPFGAKNAWAGFANAADPAGVSIGSRFLVVAGYTSASAGVLVAGDVIEQDSATPTFTKVTLADGDVYVAKVVLTGSTSVTSDASTIDDGEIAVWDSGTSKWVTVGSVTAIPDATSGSGGATKGIVTFDSDKGLSVVSGVAEVLVDGTSIGFSGGNLQAIPGGIDHANLSNLNSTSYYHLTQAEYTDLTDAGDSTLHYHASDRDRANHTGTQLSSTISDFTEAAQDAAAAMWTTGSHVAVDITYTDGSDNIEAAVRYDNTTVGINGSNQLEVKDDAITAAKLGNVIQTNEGLLQDAGGALGVDYDNVTIGIVANKLAVLNSGEVALEYTNNTGGTLAQYSVVALSKTVAGEIVAADASDADYADAEGVCKAAIANAASGKVIVKGDTQVLTDGTALAPGKWVYVAGGANAGKASKFATGSYVVKLGRATAGNKVSIDKQWIG